MILVDFYGNHYGTCVARMSFFSLISWFLNPASRVNIHRLCVHGHGLAICFLSMMPTWYIVSMSIPFTQKEVK